MSAEDPRPLSSREARKQRQSRYESITQLLIPLSTKPDELKETLQREGLSETGLYELGAAGQEYWILKGLQEEVNGTSRYRTAVDATSDGLDILYLKIGLPDRLDEIERAKQAGIIRALDKIKHPDIDLVVPMYGIAQMTAQQKGLQFVTKHLGEPVGSIDQLEVPTRLGKTIVIAYSYKHLPTGDGPLPTSRPEGIFIRVDPIKATRR